MTYVIEQRLLTRNFTKGRQPIGYKRAFTPKQITDHVSEGNAASVIEWFNDPRAEVSSHYLVTIAGKIIQFVLEADTAWHNGRVSQPTAPLVVADPNVNPNLYSIGIEHEGDGRHELTDQQRAATLWLHQDICHRWKIPFDRRVIVGHHEVYAKKTCPGKIDVDRLVRELQQQGQVVATKPQPQIRWSGYFKEWIIPLEIRSDTDWTFCLFSELQQGHFHTIKAEAPFSQMPLHP